jgi:hypothetical protein
MIHIYAYYKNIIRHYYNVMGAIRCYVEARIIDVLQRHAGRLIMLC